jgi:hypothetical protein
MRRARPLPVLLLLCTTACWGGEPAPQDCATLTGEEADGCWAERATDPGLGVELRQRAALRIQDPSLRDLALLQSAHQLGEDACEAIQDRSSREACRQRTRRPHLDIPEPPEHSRTRPRDALPLDAPGAPQARARAEQACGEQPAALRGPCLQRAASREEPGLSWVACALIADPDLGGDCAAQAASRLGAAEEVELLAGLCGSLDDPRWRGECRFRGSEALPLSQLEAAARSCAQAEGFADECLKHLIQRQAQAAALRAMFGDAEETFAGMALDLERLEATLEAQPEAAWLRRLYWYEAFHALLVHAHDQGRLSSLIPQGVALLGTDPRAEIWRDCAGKLCALERAVAAEPGSPPDLEALAAPCGEVSPAGRGALLEAFEARQGSVATSEVPAPLQPGARCTVSAPTRRILVALWGLEQLGWDRSRAPVASALDHPEAIVRAYTLDMVEHKAFFWQRQDLAAQRWLVQRLATLAEKDPSEPIRQRAAVLGEALAAGERPGRWAFHSSGVCGTPGSP